MKRALHRRQGFNADFNMQYQWYLEHADEGVGERFVSAVVGTLDLLRSQPDLGKRRKFRNPALRDLRSIGVARPYHKILIFYRYSEDTLDAWRLMHGARDLPRRLAEALEPAD